MTINSFGRLQLACLRDAYNFLNFIGKTSMHLDMVINLKIFNFSHILLFGLEVIIGVGQRFIKLRADTIACLFTRR